MTPELAEVDVHELLRNERRRQAIKHLKRHDGSLNVRELSELIAEDESGEAPPPRSLRQSVYVSLHQTHLPKLDTFGIVEYDIAAKTVTLQDGVEQLDAYLGEDGDTSPELRAEYYGIIAAVGLGGLLANVTGVPGFRAVAPSLLPVLSLVAILGLTLYESGWRPRVPASIVNAVRKQ